MKRIILFLFTLFILASCDRTTGSGNIISETRTVGNFDAINVGGGFNVEVKIGSPASVRVEADDNIMKYIEITDVGSTLNIRTEDLHNYSNVHMNVYITMPSLKNVKASASAEVVVQDIVESDSRLSFRASSSASIKAEVNAPEIESDASSSATITLNSNIPS